MMVRRLTATIAMLALLIAQATALPLPLRPWQEDGRVTRVESRFDITDVKIDQGWVSGTLVATIDTGLFEVPLATPFKTLQNTSFKQKIGSIEITLDVRIADPTTVCFKLFAGPVQVGNELCKKVV
ncbi:hypothetical protein [Prosthecomicrobium sp. N25]|uniref:hypothetical protein n=1 Tax=Prosthecomicrobium sp. N25 TaxID=3129254 RepID=UPI00307701EA